MDDKLVLSPTLDMANFDFQDMNLSFTDVPIESIVPTVPATHEMEGLLSEVDVFNLTDTSCSILDGGDSLGHLIDNFDIDFDVSDLRDSLTQDYIPISSHQENSNKSDTSETESNSPRVERRQSVRIQDRVRKEIAGRIRQENLRLEEEALRIPTNQKKESEETTNQPQGTERVKDAPEDGHKSAIDVPSQETTREESQQEVYDDVEDHSDVAQEEEYDEDDDPNKLWCICRQPHGYRFMICCDLCDDWHHGDCVGITEDRGLEMDANGEEFVCPACQKKAVEKEKVEEESAQGEEELTPPVIEEKREEGKKKVERDVVEKKKEVVVPLPKERIGRQASRATRRLRTKRSRLEPANQSSGGPVCLGPGCSASMDVRSGLYCSERCTRKYVKETIQLNRAEKLRRFGKKGVELSRMQQFVMLERRSGNVLSGRKAPREDNLLHFLTVYPTYEVIRNMDALSSEPKSNLERGAEARQSSQPRVHPTRLRVRHMFADNLQKRIKEAGDLFVSSREFLRVVLNLEEALYSHYEGDLTFGYQAKAKLLSAHLKDSQNEGLYRRLLAGLVTATRMVAMSSDQLGSDLMKKLPESKQMGPVLTVTAPSPSVVADTTRQHGSHIYDVNCRMCTGRKRKQLDASENEPKKTAKSIEELCQEMQEANEKAPAKTEQPVAALTSSQSPATASSTSLTQSGGQSPGQSLTKTTPTDPEDRVSSTVRTPELVSAPLMARSGGRHVTNESLSGSAETVGQSSSTASTPKRQRQKLSPVWRGDLFGMREAGRAGVKAYPLSGNSEDLSEDLSGEIDMVGRTEVRVVLKYLASLRHRSSKEIVLIRFHPSGEEDRTSYLALFNYLHSKNRCGVVKSLPSHIKDFYVFPLNAHAPIPKVFLPFKGPGLEDQRPHLLIGVIVQDASKKVKAEQSQEKSASSQSENPSQANAKVSGELPAMPAPPMPPKILLLDDDSPTKTPLPSQSDVEGRETGSGDLEDCYNPEEWTPCSFLGPSVMESEQSGTDGSSPLNESSLLLPPPAIAVTSQSSAQPRPRVANPFARPHDPRLGRY